MNDKNRTGYSVLDKAVQNFVLDIVMKKDAQIKYHCNKDPSNAKYIRYFI